MTYNIMSKQISHLRGKSISIKNQPIAGKYWPGDKVEAIINRNREIVTILTSKFISDLEIVIVKLNNGHKKEINKINILNKI